MNVNQVQGNLSRLLTDESRALEHLAENAERFLRIDKANGEMVLSVPRAYVSDTNFLGLLLLSRYFASKLGLANKETMTLKEIIERSSLDEGTVASRLAELNWHGIIERGSEGEIGISHSKAEYFLEAAKQDILEEGNRSDLFAQSLLVREEGDPESILKKGMSRGQIIFLFTTRRIV